MLFSEIGITRAFTPQLFAVRTQIFPRQIGSAFRLALAERQQNGFLKAYVLLGCRAS